MSGWVRNDCRQQECRGIFRICTPDIKIFILLGLTALYCIAGFITQGGPSYTKDMLSHVSQAEQFRKSLGEGLWYPRWTPDFNNGYGSANFVFYAPLPYYLVSVIGLSGFSLVSSMTFAAWISFFLSGAAMFVAARKIFGSQGGIVSAVLYQLLPFHLRDLYYRGAFAGLFAYILAPLLVYYLYEVLETGSLRAVIGLGVSYAGLIFSHLASGFIFSFVIGVFVVYHTLNRDRTCIRRFPAPVALGIGLSAVYLLPVVFEQKFVHIDNIVTIDFGDYKKNFLFMNGFDFVHRDFSLLLNSSVFIETVFLCLIIAYAATKKEMSLYHKSYGKFFILLYFLSLFLTTPLSGPIWNTVPGFTYLQFPWRFIPVMDLCLCFSIGSVFAFEDRPRIHSKTLLERSIAYFIMLFLVGSLGSVFMTDFIPKSFYKKFDVMEYVPIWADNSDDIISDGKERKVSVIYGSADTAIMKWLSEERTVNVTALLPSVLRIATFYYPGWQAHINGKPAEIKIEKNSGAMLIDIPSGTNIVELRFVDTPIRSYSKILSFLTLLIVALLAVIRRNIDRQTGKITARTS